MWQPSATHEILKQRAALIKKIRAFFEARRILEVETLCLSPHTTTAPYIQSIEAVYKRGHVHTTWYLQTSPEYYMKRLLASGSGDIFQICKSFRNDESGRLHNPEFTLLEWYRLGFSDCQLMNETDELVQYVLTCPPAERYSYTEIFQKLLALDVTHASVTALQDCALRYHLVDPGWGDDRDAWLLFLFAELIEPQLQLPTFIYDFPSTQAALARLKTNGCAARFEFYIQGLELANGFEELTDAIEQERRFKADQAVRQQYNLPPQAIDQELLSALRHGLPACAGIALGVDRLMMLALQQKSIAAVMSFVL